MDVKMYSKMPTEKYLGGLGGQLNRSDQGDQVTLRKLAHAIYRDSFSFKN